jgi:hypothetical protein
MLIEFSVENFRSFRNRATLSMVATSDKTLPGNVVDCSREGRCLRTATIYGANASGKSNLIAAIQLMRNMVLTSHMTQKGFKILHQPFKMDETYHGRPTAFEVVFTIGDVKYEYGFSHDSEKIHEEHLYAYPRGRRSLVFKRNDTGTYDFTKDIGRQEDIKEWTLPNALYLSIATQRSYEPAARAFEWFRDYLRVGMFPEGPHNTVNMILHSPHQKAAIMKALSAADVGISDIVPERKMLKLEEAPIPPELRDLFRGSGDDKFEAINIRSVHEVTVKGRKSRVVLDSSEESMGTMRLFEMIGPWIDAIQNGRVLVWDELDLRLHPLLSIFLIGLFHNSTQNKTDAQLIFTTHNTNLLDSDLLRRDQIWFTEKDSESGNSVLYSLVEFKPRKDKNLQIGYLSGRYGALPFIGTEKVI